MHYKVLIGTTSPRDLLMSTKLGGHFVRYKVLIDAIWVVWAEDSVRGIVMKHLRGLRTSGDQDWMKIEVALWEGL